MSTVALGRHFSRGPYLLATRTWCLVDTRRAARCAPSHIIKGSQHAVQGGGRQYCCRQLHIKPDGSSSPTIRERLGELRRNGIPEIVFGSIIVALVGIDYVVQLNMDEQREEMSRHLERAVKRDEATTREENERMLNGDAATEPMFKCIVRRVPQFFDGHKCLKNVKVGDVVDVIEEGLGPEGKYSLCSMERGSAGNHAEEDLPGKKHRVSIGWFPCSCLQKIE